MSWINNIHILGVFLLANTANVDYHDIRRCGTKRNEGEVGVLASYEEIWAF
jgi:hypothetical protein